MRARHFSTLTAFFRYATLSLRHRLIERPRGAGVWV